jgi:hypothetical protein
LVTGAASLDNLFHHNLSGGTLKTAVLPVAAFWVASPFSAAEEA